MRSAIERYVIRHISGSKANQVEEFDFSKPELKIGRSAESNIQFDPESDVVVSREHGKIVKEGSEPPEFSIIDHNSRNGIFVNKERVKGSRKLNPGDEVQLGNNGPVFVFDIFPRPQDMMAATRVMEIPTTIKPTSISAVEPANVVSTEPVKTGLGKQTVERMLVAERKKSSGKIAMILGSLVVVLGILGYTFRDKLFPKPQVTVLTKKETVTDPKLLNKMSPDQIAKANEDKVVAVEFSWYLKDNASNGELHHQYEIMKDQNGQIIVQALYIRNQNGGIEPYLEIKRNIPNVPSVPISIMGGSGSGFVITDGFIVTNRHVAAGWQTRWDFARHAFPGALVSFDDKGQRTVTPNVVNFNNVAGWVPQNTTMVSGKPVGFEGIRGENAYIEVIFSGTSLRRKITSVQPSQTHDVAVMKLDIGQPLSPVKTKDNYDQIKPGQSVTVMGYPGVAPVQIVASKSHDPFNRQVHYVSVPTPTVTPGSIGRIIPGTNEKLDRYSGFGDSYQLTINATGGGNSGGPMFDDEGNVIGIYYAGKSDPDGTAQISFAIPIKYALELLGHTKVGGN